MEILDEVPQNQNKQRHGCVTAWLVFMIIVNSISGLANIFYNDIIARQIGNSSAGMFIVLLGVLGLLNVLFAVFILKWKKMGFWGFAGTSVVACVINVAVGLPVGQSLFGLIGMGILYAILQFSANNKTAWENLD